MRIEVELEDEEFADLQEFVKHHPENFKDPSEALKKMAGLKMYRQMKQKLDPKRKKSPILGPDVGIPSFYPCALDEILKQDGITYQDFINVSIKHAITMMEAQLAKGNYTIVKGEGVIIAETDEMAKWAEEHPGVILTGTVGDTDEIEIKGEPK